MPIFLTSFVRRSRKSIANLQDRDLEIPRAEQQLCKFPLELVVSVAGGVVAAGERAGAHDRDGSSHQPELSEQRGTERRLSDVFYGDCSK